jgi:hypothetical protein
MIVAIVLAAVGDIYSEKPVFNGVFLMLSACFSGGTIATWLNVAKTFEEIATETDPSGVDVFADATFQIGLGFMFLIAGCAMAFVSVGARGGGRTPLNCLWVHCLCMGCQLAG